jgi:hypothetical protein
LARNLLVVHFEMGNSRRVRHRPRRPAIQCHWPSPIHRTIYTILHIALAKDSFSKNVKMLTIYCTGGGGWPPHLIFFYKCHDKLYSRQASRSPVFVLANRPNIPTRCDGDSQHSPGNNREEDCLLSIEFRITLTSRLGPDAHFRKVAGPVRVRLNQRCRNR